MPGLVPGIHAIYTTGSTEIRKFFRILLGVDVGPKIMNVSPLSRWACE